MSTAAAVRGLAGNGLQPLPCAIARRIAAAELPPAQIGGCGCCTQRGRTMLLRQLVGPRRLHRPERLVEAPGPLGERHAETPRTRLRGSRPRPRGSRGRASTRRASRPTSRSRNGFRYAGIRQLVCSRRRRVAAAANESATNGSSVSCPPVSSHERDGNGWSVTKHASKPASSIASAHVISASGDATGSSTENFIRRSTCSPAAPTAARASPRTRAGPPPGRDGPTSRRARPRRPCTRR